MLPDYTKIRSKVREFYEDVAKVERKKHLGVFNEIKSSRVFEGRKLELIRQDGEIDTNEIQTFQSSFFIEPEEIEKITIFDIIQRVKDVSKEMSEQFLKYFFDMIQESTEKVGNVVDLRGGGITPEHIFEFYERVFLDFDEELRPTKKVFIANKAAQEQFMNSMKQIENDPELTKKMNEILDRKRKEYLDRENSRELVG